MANPDLSNTNNPYASGKMNQDDPTADTGAGYSNTPAGYWSRGVSGSFTPSENPYSGGAGTHAASEAEASRYMQGGLGGLYDDSLWERQPGGHLRNDSYRASGTDSHTLADVLRDEGLDKTGR